MSKARTTAADVPAWGRRAVRAILWGYAGVGMLTFLIGFCVGSPRAAVFGAAFTSVAVVLSLLIRWALIVDAEIPYS